MSKSLIVRIRWEIFQRSHKNVRREFLRNLCDIYKRFQFSHDYVEKIAKKVLSSYHKSLFGEKNLKQKLELIWQHSSGLKGENLAKFVFQLFDCINQFIFQFFKHPTTVNLDQYPHR